jgi:hypothetical protein
MNRVRLTAIAVSLLAISVPGFAADFDDDITIQVIEDPDRGASGASYLDLPDFSSQEARDALEHAREQVRSREQDSEQKRGERNGDDMDEHGEGIGESRDDGSGSDWEESLDTRDTSSDLREEMNDSSETQDEMDD